METAISNINKQIYKLTDVVNQVYSQNSNKSEKREKNKRNPEQH